MASGAVSKYAGWFLAGRKVPPPRHLIIEITSRCNLRCKMCPKTHHTVNTTENQVMEWAVFERLFPLLPHIESLDLTGVWGEAFLQPELYIRMLREIKARGSDVYTISNGTLLTDDLARQLVEADLNKLTVSLDAATPGTYAKIRPPGRFEDVVKGLRSVAAWKKRLKSAQPRLELAFVGMKSNIDEFPAVIDLARELGVSQVCLQALGVYPGLEDESVAARDKGRGRRILEEARRRAAAAGVAIALQPPDMFEEDRGDRNAVENPRGRRKQCHDLWNKCLVAANGDILPCCACPAPMGNLRDASFDAIWRGPAYNALRRRFLAGDLPVMCRECTGTAWVESTLGLELGFFFGSLLVPRAKRRIRLRLRKVGPLRWAKHGLERILGKRKAEA